MEPSEESLDFTALFGFVFVKSPMLPRQGDFCGGFVSAFEVGGYRGPSQSLRTPVDDVSRWLCLCNPASSA
jgi:hypothetical protein